MGIDGTNVYFSLPQYEVVIEFKERVSADCAKMTGWRWRQRASYNVKVHCTVVLYSIKGRRGFVWVCSALKGQ